ncbi:hypothetical protein [Neobacillus cucumis]|nr:hypothetical protein [Neobacillus cucumis]
MYYYIILPHYHPWHTPLIGPIIPPPPVPPAAVTYRNRLDVFWLPRH